ncbi:hypothetical protein DMA11_00940 [Marinilabiliaceae bacterium JC017]|nr:hypothetical protein DMA11_00940 [Marinilabiliaceae bacterium JC017]
MFTATISTLNTHQEAITTITALDTSVKDFMLLYGKLTHVQMAQMSGTTGTSELKLKVENDMIKSTIKIANAIYAYAVDNNSPDLKSRVSVTASQLQRLNDQNKKASCMNIYEKANNLAGNLAEYGITPEMILILKSHIDNFVVSIASPRTAIVDRSMATAQLAKLVDDMNLLLREKIDKLMPLLEDTHPEAYQTYKSARIIIDLRRGKKKNEEETPEEGTE